MRFCASAYQSACGARVSVDVKTGVKTCPYRCDDTVFVVFVVDDVTPGVKFVEDKFVITL